MFVPNDEVEKVATHMINKYGPEMAIHISADYAFNSKFWDMVCSYIVKKKNEK